MAMPIARTESEPQDILRERLLKPEEAVQLKFPFASGRLFNWRCKIRNALLTALKCVACIAPGGHSLYEHILLTYVRCLNPRRGGCSVAAAP